MARVAKKPIIPIIPEHLFEPIMADDNNHSDDSKTSAALKSKRGKDAKDPKDAKKLELRNPRGSLTGGLALILGTMVDELERANKERALITLCVGAGMGTATVIERVN